MGIYETTYILHPALQEGRLNDIINTIEKKAESLGAEILFSDNWGRKKLSYFGVWCWFTKSFNENRGSMSKIRHVFQTCLISSSVAGSSRGAGGTRK